MRISITNTALSLWFTVAEALQVEEHLGGERFSLRFPGANRVVLVLDPDGHEISVPNDKGMNERAWQLLRRRWPDKIEALAVKLHAEQQGGKTNTNMFLGDWHFSMTTEAAVHIDIPAQFNRMRKWNPKAASTPVVEQPQYRAAIKPSDLFKGTTEITDCPEPMAHIAKRLPELLSARTDGEQIDIYQTMAVELGLGREEVKRLSFMHLYGMEAPDFEELSKVRPATLPLDNLKAAIQLVNEEVARFNDTSESALKLRLENGVLKASVTSFEEI